MTIKLIDKTDDNRHWSVEDCLKDAIQNKMFEKCNKIVIIGVDTKNDNFNTYFSQANVKISEGVAIAEFYKQEMFKFHEGEY